MTDYVSKPYTVEAIQFTGTNLEEIVEFIGSDLQVMEVTYTPSTTTLKLQTTSGVTQAEKTWWVINNEKDLWYCMSDKDFKETFVVSTGSPHEAEAKQQEKSRSQG